MAQEILEEKRKSLSQGSSCARDIGRKEEKSIARLFLRKRYWTKSGKVYRKGVLAQEILDEKKKSLSQGCSCARDIGRKEEKSIAREFLRKRYWTKRRKVYSKGVLAQEILDEKRKSLSQGSSCARDIGRKAEKSIAREFLRKRY